MDLKQEIKNMRKRNTEIKKENAKTKKEVAER